MLEHQPPLDAPAEVRGAPPAGRSGFRVTLAETGLLLLQSRSETALRDVLMSEIALGLPAAGEICARGDYALLWLTPAEWLLECPVKDAATLHGAFTRRLSGSLAIVTNIHDAYACFELSGTRVDDILMSGCSLDLRPDIFPATRVARTSLAGIAAIIRKTVEPPGFRCLIDRSHARHLREWLLMTAMVFE